MLNSIIKLDTELFFIINSALHNRVNDIFLGTVFFLCQYPVLLICSIGYLYLKKNRIRNYLRLFSVSMALSLGFALLLNIFIDRVNPAGELKAFGLSNAAQISNYLYPLNFGSFPSIQAVVSFTILLTLFFVSEIEGFYISCLLLLFSISIIYFGSAYPLDVVSGGLIALLFTKLSSTISRNLKREKKTY